MPRRLRKDYPGAWHHVVNRGISKRTLFENPRDVRFFLACLARQVRTGDLELHAYAILTTHFHLLVRSPRGRLSASMQRGLDAYARWFNRTRHRDGPLFRGRFVNRVIGDDAHFVSVVRYIDQNPVSAGLAARPQDYPYGSARHYHAETGPRWLNRRTLMAWLRGNVPAVDPRAAYEQAFGQGYDAGRNAWIVERRLRSGDGPGGERLLRSDGPEREWMRGKSLLADGNEPGHWTLHPETLREVVTQAARQCPARGLWTGAGTYPFWEVLHCGALRILSGLRHEEIRERMGMPVTGVRRRLAAHVEALGRDSDYQREFHAVITEARRRDLYGE